MQSEFESYLGDPEINSLLRLPEASRRAPLGEVVSLLGLKEFAELLPANSALRRLILDEPDYLLREKALTKMEVFAQLLQFELGARDSH